MPIFLDTSAIYALLDEDDAKHTEATAQWQSLTGKTELITTNYVLLETAALLQRRLGVEAVQIFDSLIAPVPEVVWVTADMHRTGMESLLAARRRNLNLVDCVSFAAMRREDLDTAFAFDAHFTEYGFRVVP